MIARFLAAVLIALAAAALPARAQTQGQRASVVVELYTSQGCIQCPRANRLLGVLGREPETLALTFPVGIWDYLGWQDTFARPEFSQRQRAYSTTMRVRGRFTPQLVLNGAHQISASDWDDARATFDAARAEGWPAPAPEVSLVRLRNGRVRVTLGAYTSTGPFDVWLAAYDPGPLTVTIRGGANINRTVTHYNLVTRLDRLASWNGEATWYERGRCQPQCAVIVQQRNGGRILAAAYTDRQRRS